MTLALTDGFQGTATTFVKYSWQVKPRLIPSLERSWCFAFKEKPNKGRNLPMKRHKKNSSSDNPTDSSTGMPFELWKGGRLVLGLAEGPATRVGSSCSKRCPPGEGNKPGVLSAVVASPLLQAKVASA